MIKVRAFTDVGLVRKRNEDCVLVGGWQSQARDGALVAMDFAPTMPFVCAVADGMGGHAGGNLASRVALNVLAEQSSSWRTEVDVVASLVDANEQIRAVGVETDLQGLGTTIAGVCVVATGIIVFNVGDSPVFSMTGGQLEQISIDDSVFDVHGRPTNIITQSLGQAVPVTPHVEILPLVPGTYLLCSDGVSGVMTPDELSAAARLTDHADVSAEIIRTTRTNGAHDNFSFVIVDIPDLGLPATESALTADGEASADEVRAAPETLV